MALRPQIRSALPTAYSLYVRNSDGSLRKIGTLKQLQVSYTRGQTTHRVLDADREDGYFEIIPGHVDKSMTGTRLRLYEANAFEHIVNPAEPFRDTIQQTLPLEIEKREYRPDGSVRITQFHDCWVTSFTEPLNIDTMNMSESINFQVGRVTSRISSGVL